MAKISAPLLSFGAGGTVAKTTVFSRWKGRAYVRRHVTPANPNTASQQTQRGMFQWAQSVYKIAPAAVTDTWKLYASGQVMTDRNAFSKINLAALFGETDLIKLTLCPGAKGGLVAAGMVITPGPTHLTVDLTAPALPAGWTITKGIAACIRDQNPSTGVLYAITSAEDLTTPYSIDLTGLTASVLYQVCGWFQYAKPDGSVAYGPALLAQSTPTV